MRPVLVLFLTKTLSELRASAAVHPFIFPYVPLSSSLCEHVCTDTQIGRGGGAC